MGLRTDPEAVAAMRKALAQHGLVNCDHVDRMSDDEVIAVAQGLIDGCEQLARSVRTLATSFVAGMAAAVAPLAARLRDMPRVEP